MPRIHLILLSSALILALPGWAEAGAEKAPAKQIRPLNLSLPRDVLMQTPGSGNADETVMRNLRAPAQTSTGSSPTTRPASLPYGAGFEHRHQEMGGMNGMGGGAGHGAGAGGRSGGGSAERHGR
jgi:hypothetical protein